MRTAITLFATLFASTLLALDTSKLKPAGYVNDFAHALDAASAQRLEAYCAKLEQTTGVQMAVVLVDSLEDDAIDDVANRLYRQWGIGKKGKDEGILLLFAVRDRRDRAEIGYGLEPIVTDGYAGGVLRGVRPILRQGNYGGALLAAAQELGSHIGQAKGVDLGEEKPLRRARPAPRGGSIPWPVLIGGFFIVMWIIGRMSGGGRGGGGGFLTGMILGNLMGRSSGWGGGGFGSGSGGGGFGGFGGGDSGGGGASSDW